MITDWVLASVGFLIGLFPAFDPFPSLDTMVASWYALPVVGDGLEVLAYIDHYIPVNEAISLVGFTVTLLGLWLTWWAVNWIWKLLPFS